jgi:hypothetical protein
MEEVNEQINDLSSEIDIAKHPILLAWSTAWGKEHMKKERYIDKKIIER